MLLKLNPPAPVKVEVVAPRRPSRLRKLLVGLGKLIGWVISKTLKALWWLTQIAVAGAFQAFLKWPRPATTLYAIVWAYIHPPWWIDWLSWGSVLLWVACPLVPACVISGVEWWSRPPAEFPIPDEALIWMTTIAGTAPLELEGARSGGAASPGVPTAS